MPDDVDISAQVGARISSANVPGAPPGMDPNLFETVARASSADDQPYGPPIAWGSYKAFQRGKSSVWDDLANEYALAGRPYAVGGQTFMGRFESQLVDYGMAIPSVAPTLRPYAQFETDRREVYQGLADRYVQEGKGYEVGQEVFQSELESAYAAQGLGPKPKSPIAKMFEDKAGLGFGVGYAALAFGQGYAQQARLLGSGNYVSPEQAQSSKVEAFAPGFGTLAGTFIGGAVGSLIPGIGTVAGGLAGQFVGGAAGEMYAATVGASAERQESSRVTAEQLAASLGEAASKVKEFQSAIEAAGAPVKQLQAVFETLTTLGPTSPSAIGGASRMTVAMGERAEQSYASLARQFEDPQLFNLRLQSASNGVLSRGQYQELAEDAAFRGDWSTVVERNKDAQDALLANNPRYQMEARRADADRSASGLFGAFVRGALTPFGPMGGLLNVGYTYGLGYVHAENAQNIKDHLPGDPTADRRKEIFENLGKATADSDLAGTNFMTLGGAAGVLTASGAYTATSLEVSSLGYFNAAGAALAANRRREDQLRDAISDPAMADVRGARQKELSQSIAQDLAIQAGVAGRRRSIWGQNFEEKVSAFEVDATSRLYGGYSAAARKKLTDQEARYLENVAADPTAPITPQERDKDLIEGMTLYRQGRIGLYAEREGELGIGYARAGVGVAQSMATGTPREIYDARIAQTERLVELEKQINDEIKKGGLLKEEVQAKERQAAELRSTIIEQRKQAALDYYGDQGSLLGATFSADSAGADRLVLRGGNAAFDTRLLDDVGRQIALNRKAQYDKRLSPVENEQARARAEQFENTRDSLLDVENRYAPSASESANELRIRGAFERSQLSPYLDGTNSNPFTAGAAVLGLDRSRLSSLDANRRQKQAAGTWRPEDELEYTRQREGYLDDEAQVEDRRIRAMFEAVPEALVGGLSGGAGAGVVPLAAVSAYFSPSPVAGSFGRSKALPSVVPMAVEGGGVGAAASDANTQVLREIAGLLRQVVSRGSGFGGDRPRDDFVPVLNDALAHGIDVYRR